MFTEVTTDLLAGDLGYLAIQALPGIGPVGGGRRGDLVGA